MKRLMTVLLGLLLTVACSTKRNPQLKGDPPIDLIQGQSEFRDVEKLVPSLSIGTEWASIPPLEIIYFTTDRADLTETARRALKRNGDILKILVDEVPDLEIRIEGHCDERATLEYNLALGERRALAVKNHYGTLGVPKRILSTLSYGEERPLCSRSEESCWHLNRRSVTVLRAKTALRVPLDKLPPPK